jgi:hypothetical protein
MILHLCQYFAHMDHIIMQVYLYPNPKLDLLHFCLFSIFQSFFYRPSNQKLYHFNENCEIMWIVVFEQTTNNLVNRQIKTSHNG